jgi:signal transduction histidine kinase
MDQDMASVDRTRTRGADLLLAATLVMSLTALAMAIVALPHLKPADVYSLPLSLVPAYALLGWLIIRRVNNAIGWLLLAEGVAGVVVSITSFYAILGVANGSLPGPKLVGVASESLFVPVVMILAFMLLLFPTGSLPSPRWRWVGVAFVAATAVGLVSFILVPRHVALPAGGGISLTYENPLGVNALRANPFGTLPGFAAASALMFGAAAIALVVRYRAGDLVLRQQIKWVGFFAGLFVASQVVLSVLLAAFGTDATITTVVGLVSGGLAVLGFPIAITIAILRYGLFDIDVIINRAVVYGILATALTVVYVAIVAGVGALAGYGGGPPLTVAAAVAIAVLFQPLRHRAQTLANRLVYGDRATPYQVLSDFADAMAQTSPLDEQLDRLVALVASGTGADRVEVWIRVGAEQRLEALWPGGAQAGSPPTATEVAVQGTSGVFPVRQEGELLGSIVVVKPRNEPLSTSEAGLAEHTASQAGLVVRNVRLTAELQHTIDELRASRRRLVQAQDIERRKIERNLHDGAQQQLVAIGVQLALLERLAGDAPSPTTQVIPRLREMLNDALDDLRDLARGIYPPLLADQGLVAALEAQARKSVVPTVVEARDVERYDQQVEAAVYFCTLEALQNVAKYAGATEAVVRLVASDGQLGFEIADNGQGFDPDAAKGSGLQGMADRLDAIGGRIEIDSHLGHGTVVRGAIDLRRAE